MARKAATVTMREEYPGNPAGAGPIATGCIGRACRVMRCAVPLRGNGDAYLAAGIPIAAALARTSMDLGHGDGRGRWVKMIYLR